LLGSLRAFGIGRFLKLEYQKSSAANTKHPQSATCFASLAYFTRTINALRKRKRSRETFQTKTARVVGAAGDDFWYPSMKSPPYLRPVPYPARTLDERELFKSEGITEQNNADKLKTPDTE
jgi:hypothetical protein